jgi:hypothetical protein
MGRFFLLTHAARRPRPPTQQARADGPDGIKTTDRIEPGRFNRRLNPGLMVQA